MYVKMHHEKKTAEKLSKMGITNFLPVQEVVKQWSDRKKKVKQILIPMIIFVYIDDKTRIEILNLIPSVIGTLIDKATNRPAVIRNEEMERFIFMLDYSENSIKFITEPLEPGEIVEVIKGPLAGLQGEFIEEEGKSNVYVRIDMLGCAIVEIPISYLRKTEKNNIKNKILLNNP